MTAKEITLDLIIRYGFKCLARSSFLPWVFFWPAGSVTSATAGTIRQLQLKVGIAYGANLDEVLLVAKEIAAANPRVLKEPAPLIGISELADSSLTLSIQPWVAVSDMVSARAELYKTIVERFRASKIDIPFPVREVRLLGAS